METVSSKQFPNRAIQRACQAYNMGSRSKNYLTITCEYTQANPLSFKKGSLWSVVVDDWLEMRVFATLLSFETQDFELLVESAPLIKVSLKT